MVVNVQYCFDEVSSVGVNGFGGKENCCYTGAQKTEECCSDETKIVKLQESHKAAFASYNIDAAIQLSALPFSFINPSATLPVDDELIRISDSSPPSGSSPSIYIKNCGFRI